jgi:hypothetical protein
VGKAMFTIASFAVAKQMTEDKTALPFHLMRSNIE